MHTLAYTDGMVIMAETATQMKEMMKTINKYLTRRNLKLNSEKSKVVVFRKGSKRGRGKNGSRTMKVLRRWRSLTTWYACLAVTIIQSDI